MSKAKRVETNGTQWVDLDDQEYEVSYLVTASMTYDPGRVSGPPEDCYPPEGECSIEDITIELVENSLGEEVNSEEIIKQCKLALDLDKVEEKLWEAFHECE